MLFGLLGISFEQMYNLVKKYWTRRYSPLCSFLSFVSEAEALTIAMHHTGNTYDSIGKSFEEQVD